MKSMFLIFFSGLLVVGLVIALAQFAPQKLFHLLPQLNRISWIWTGIFLALLLFLSVYAGFGLIQTHWLPAILCTSVLAIAAIVSLYNKQIRAAFNTLFAYQRLLLEIGLLLIGTFLTFIAIELPSNPAIAGFWIEGLILENVIILVIFLIFHLLFQRSGAGAVIAAFLFECAGLAEYFVVSFKGVPIIASDILALGTAATVSGSYSYVLNERVLISFAVFALALVVLSLTPKPQHAKRPAIAFVANTFGGLIMAGIAVFIATTVSFSEFPGIKYNAWIPLDSYHREGFISSFVTQIQSFRPVQPKGYSKEEAEKLLSGYANKYEENLAQTDSSSSSNANS